MRKRTKRTAGRRPTTIDPRLARVHALIEDLHPHNIPGGGTSRLPEVLKLLFERVRWELVEVRKVQAIFTAIMSATPGDTQEVFDARSEMLDELAAVGNDRASREVRLLDRLGWLRSHNPNEYSKAMKRLVRLAAQSKSRKVA